MSVVSLISIALGLAMDATAVAIATSILLERVNRRQVFRFAFHFGLFQAVMPIVGWFFGRELSAHIEKWDHWVAFLLLLLVGGKAILDVLKDPQGTNPNVSDPTRGWSLVVLSVATSIDALAIGLSLAILQVNIWIPAIVIGIVTSVLTVGGMLLGARLGKQFGQGVRILGGTVLIGIGIKILLEHMLA